MLLEVLAVFVLGLLCGVVLTVSAIRAYDPSAETLWLLYPEYRKAAKVKLQQLLKEKKAAAAAAAASVRKAERKAAVPFELPRKEGWLERKGLGFKSNYVVLEDGWLSFYKSEERRKDECYGSVKLSECVVRTKRSDFCFEVYNTHKQPVLFPLSNSSERTPEPTLSSSAPVAPRSALDIPSELFELAFGGKSWVCVLNARSAAERSEWISLIQVSISPPTPRPASEDAIAVVEEVDLEEKVESGLFSQVRFTQERPDADVQAIKDLLKTKEVLSSGVFDPAIHDDACLLRFLRARGYNAKDAAAMFVNDAKWRLAVRPEAIEASAVQDVLNERMMYIIGRDREGVLVALGYPGRMKPSAFSAEKMISFLLYAYEQTIRVAMQPPEESFVLLIDMKGFSLSCLDSGLAQKAAGILSDHYPERMKAAYVVNPPFIVNGIYAMIKPLMRKETQRKVQFFSQDKLVKYLHPDVIPKSLGGNSDADEKPPSLGMENLARTWK